MSFNDINPGNADISLSSQYIYYIEILSFKI